MSDATFDLVDLKDAFTRMDWFDFCRKTRIPYVVVRRGERSADVLWDYVTLPPCCDARIQGDFAALEHKVRAIFQRLSTPDSYLRIKPTLIGLDRLPLAQAERAAVELYDLIAAYLPDDTPVRPLLEHNGRAIPLNRGRDIDRDPQGAVGRRHFWGEGNERASSAA